MSGSHVPDSQFEGHGFQGHRVPGSQVPGSQSPGSQGPGSQGPGVPGLRILRSRVSGLRVPCPGSQVLILDYVVDSVGCSAKELF